MHVRACVSAVHVCACSNVPERAPDCCQAPPHMSARVCVLESSPCEVNGLEHCGVAQRATGILCCVHGVCGYQTCRAHRCFPGGCCMHAHTESCCWSCINAAQAGQLSLNARVLAQVRVRAIKVRTPGERSWASPPFTHVAAQAHGCMPAPTHTDSRLHFSFTNSGHVATQAGPSCHACPTTTCLRCCCCSWWRL